MEISIATPTTRLLTNVSQPFLLIKLMHNYFLLTKTVSQDYLDKNINFEVQGKSFYSTFARHVNLSYSGKLSELVDCLSILPNPGLQHQWLMLYQIHDFSAVQQKKYKVQSPSYGSDVLIIGRDGCKQKSRISSLFRRSGQSFYFLSNQNQPMKELSFVTNLSQQIIYGITYKVKEIVVCLPFHIIYSEKPCPFNICPEIKPMLMKTCYIRSNGSFCTGFIYDEKRIISAKHLLSPEDQKVGIEVWVRLFPYNQQKKGVISQIGSGNLDFIQITLAQSMLSKNNVAVFETQKQFAKVREQSLTGKQILAIGFGKFSYSSAIFNRIDIVMPTIEVGIVSKIIKLGDTFVFLKTDASLYNGFSGCGIWEGANLIGMAVFILKNKTSNSNFNRHNFSYTIEFISKVINDCGGKKQLIGDLNEKLQRFDKIQTRYKIPLSPRI